MVTLSNIPQVTKNVLLLHSRCYKIKLEKIENKAGYTAQDAPSTSLKITWDGRTDGRNDGRTDGRTDTTSYRDATAHLKTREEVKVLDNREIMRVDDSR